jgi:hypothetical protein
MISLEHRRKRIRRTSEFVAVDGLAAGAISFRKVATLEHELGNDTVETRALVSVAILTSSELAEVAAGLGHYIVIEFEDDAGGLVVANFDIKLKMKKKTYQLVIDLHRDDLGS